MTVATNIHSSGHWAQWEQCDGNHCDKGSRYRRKIKLPDTVEIHDRGCGNASKNLTNNTITKNLMQ